MSTVLPALRAFAPKKADKMYLVANEPSGGQSHILRLVLNHYSSKLKKNKSKRTPSIAIRLAFALLHPDVREEAAKYLASKLSKDDQNQSDKPELNFCRKSLISSAL